jgi:hypothetical protein
MTSPAVPLPSLTVLDADVHGALAVFPLLRPEPGALEYLSLVEGLGGGVAVKELPEGASVNDLLVVNPLDVPVLCFEGEQVAGAQQDRTFDVSVLVAPGSELRVPVSCVERGRWDGSRHGEGFTAAGDAAYPDLRRRKATRMAEAALRGAPMRASQAEVWQEVAAKQRRLATPSATGALRDAFEGHRAALGAHVAAVSRREGQVGALVAIGGRFTVLDAVGRADVWAALHGALVQGYALDAVDAGAARAGTAPDRDAAREWLDATLRATWAPAPAVGMGRQLALRSAARVGTGLDCDGELVQLSAFPGEDGPAADGRRGGPARVLRPSRRGR